MANWSTLKQAIANVIKTNGNQEITGQILQNALFAIVNSVGENYTFAGVADTSTEPGSPDGHVFYIATKSGEYSNFGGITIDKEVAIIRNTADGSWEKINTGIVSVESLIEGGEIVIKVDVKPATETTLGGINASPKTEEETVEAKIGKDNKLYVPASTSAKNLADEEDLTSKVEDSKSVMKFADKAYDASSFSGQGRVYLRKNIVLGKNILTQSMINDDNTRYIIQYDYDLNGETISIPEGCTLDFQGGSFNNGILYINYTDIKGNPRIYTDIAEGSHLKTIYVKWFDDESQDSTVLFERVRKLISDSAVKIIFESDKEYTVKPTYLNMFELPSNSVVEGNNATIRIADNSNTDTFTWDSIFYVANGISNVIIQNITIDCNGDNNTNLYGEFGSNEINNAILICKDTNDFGQFRKNVTLRNCTHKNSVGLRAVFLSYANDITIENCSFIDSGPAVTTGVIADHSTIMGVGHRWVINNNYLYNSTQHSQGTGLDLACSDSIISDNYVCNSWAGMNLANNGINSCSNNVVERNRFVDNKRTGIMLWATTTPYIGGCYNNIIKDNVIKYVARGGGYGYYKGIDANWQVYGEVKGLYIKHNSFMCELPDTIPSASHEAFIFIGPNDKKWTGTDNVTASISDVIIEDNTFENSTDSAIIVGNRSIDVRIKNNIIRDICVNSDSGSSYAAIYINPSNSNENWEAHDITVEGNNIQNANYTKCTYGIYSRKYVYNLKIINNIINVNNYSGLYILSDSVVAGGTNGNVYNHFIHVEHELYKTLSTGFVNNIKADSSSRIYDRYRNVVYHPERNIYATGIWRWIARSFNEYPNSPELASQAEGNIILSRKPITSGCIGWINTYDSSTSKITWKKIIEIPT